MHKRGAFLTQNSSIPYEVVAMNAISVIKKLMEIQADIIQEIITRNVSGRKHWNELQMEGSSCGFGKRVESPGEGQKAKRR